MSRKTQRAAAYYRTSSAVNVGGDKDSLKRQKEAVYAYAEYHKVEVVAEFYDAAVSGADAIDARPGFVELLERLEGNGIGLVLVEDATRFARDLAVQLAGHELLKSYGVELVPVNAPDLFREDTPTAVLVRQVLGAISQFEKASLVVKLKGARDRASAKAGRRVEGRPPVPERVVREAKRLYRRNPKTGKRRSLRAIARALAERDHRGPSGKEYGPESVKRMVART